MSFTREFLYTDMKQDNDKRHELMFECQLIGAPHNVKLYHHMIMMIEKNKMYINVLLKENEYFRTLIKNTLRPPFYSEDLEDNPYDKIRYLEEMLSKYRLQGQLKFDNHKIDIEGSE